MEAQAGKIAKEVCRYTEQGPHPKVGAVFLSLLG